MAFFYPVFILACLNRESACFISMAVSSSDGFEWINRNEILVRNKMILLHVSFQALLWLALAFFSVMHLEPGDFFEEPTHDRLFIGKRHARGHWAETLHGSSPYLRASGSFP